MVVDGKFHAVFRISLFLPYMEGQSTNLIVLDFLVTPEH